MRSSTACSTCEGLWGADWRLNGPVGFFSPRTPPAPAARSHHRDAAPPFYVWNLPKPLEQLIAVGVGREPIECLQASPHRHGDIIKANDTSTAGLNAPAWSAFGLMPDEQHGGVWVGQAFGVDQVMNDAASCAHAAPGDDDDRPIHLPHHRRVAPRS